MKQNQNCNTSLLIHLYSSVQNYEAFGLKFLLLPRGGIMGMLNYLLGPRMRLTYKGNEKGFAMFTPQPHSAAAKYLGAVGEGFSACWAAVLNFSRFGLKSTPSWKRRSYMQNRRVLFKRKRNGYVSQCFWLGSLYCRKWLLAYFKWLSTRLLNTLA